MRKPVVGPTAGARQYRTLASDLDPDSDRMLDVSERFCRSAGLTDAFTRTAKRLEDPQRAVAEAAPGQIARQPCDPRAIANRDDRATAGGEMRPQPLERRGVEAEALRLLDRPA